MAKVQISRGYKAFITQRLRYGTDCHKKWGQLGAQRRWGSEVGAEK